MKRISALLHTHDQERALGRTLESLRFSDEIVVVDHGSKDKTEKIARQYGARVVHAVVGVDRGGYAVDCKHDWIFCVLPGEAISEELEASVQEWKHQKNGEGAGLMVPIRKQTGEQWQSADAEMRLANRTKVNWRDLFPSPTSGAGILRGDLLRFDD